MRLRLTTLALVLAAASLPAQITCASTDTLVVNRDRTGMLCVPRPVVVTPPPVVITPTPPPVVMQPPPAGGSGPDTIGMTKLAERGFSTLDTAGWYRESKPSNRVQVVQTDRGAAVQQNYLPGLPAGESPTSLGNDNIAQRRILYAATWIRISSNFVGHSGDVNKVIHFYTNGGNKAILIFRGQGTGPLRPEFNMQGLAAPYTFYENGKAITGSTEANLHTSTCTVTRGAWHKYEIVLTNNTPGVPDGKVDLWMDGVKCLGFAGITYVPAGANNKWTEVNWSPTYGGGYSPITSPFWMQMDHIVLSGK